jgi:hypothetical protein
MSLLSYGSFEVLEMFLKAKKCDAPLRILIDPDIICH